MKKTLDWKRYILDRVYIDNKACWNWLQVILPSGYGEAFREKTIRAHRLSYQIFRGEIPKSLVLDHLCRNKKCVNPWHLEYVTNLVNLKRSPLWVGNKDHCKNGHPYTKENTYNGGSRKGKDFYRGCKMCAHLKYMRVKKNAPR